MAIAITRLLILTGWPRRASGSLMLCERSSPQSVPCGVRSRDFHRRSCVSIPRIRADPS
jgi:hypothetical protein